MPGFGGFARSIGAIGYFDAVLSEPDEAGSDLQNA
jgi:hypothetical protein